MKPIEKNCSSFSRQIPVTFTYGDRESADMDWQLEAKSESEEAGDRIQTTEYLHLPSAVRLRITCAHTCEYGAQEWRAELIAGEDTEIFGNIHWEFGIGGNNGRLIGNYGDSVHEFAEYEAELSRGPVSHEAADGRPTHVYFPYYRLETNEQKLIAVLNWQGTWFAKFVQKAACVEFTGGQLNVNTRLFRGEVFCLPAVLFLPYTEDPINTWRHFYMERCMPPVRGKRISPLLGIYNGSCEGLNEAVIDRLYGAYEEAGIDYDFWWFDAGWGTDGTGCGNKSGKWYHGLNTEMNREAFPAALASLGRKLKESGRDFLLWFEPELIRTPPEDFDALFAGHPDLKRKWILGVYQYEWCGITLTAQMLDLGDRDCRDWLVKRVTDVMSEAGATIYRQDFNIPPAEVWKNCDASDRRGMTENRYCSGLLAFYRDIKGKCRPVFMDSCASGGGRLDLDTMRLMLPLHYSDHQDVAPCDFNGHLYMQQILWRWFPYTKNFLTPVNMQDDYGARSVMNPCLVFGADPGLIEQVDWNRLRSVIGEWRGICGAYLGDYYELAPASRDDLRVKAFEFIRPDTDSGFAMVFAPANCPDSEFKLLLRGLKPDAEYLVECGGMATEEWGERLASDGITVKLRQNTSYLFTVRKRK